MFMALTDVPYAQHFDIDTLDTIGLLAPAPEMKMMTACTHWQREPGTDNSISFIFKVRISKLSVIHILKRQDTAQFQLTQFLILILIF